MSNKSEVTYPDGTIDFSGGINSVCTPTIQSSDNPGGLQRNQLAWGNNLTVRDGGISPRAGWNHNMDLLPKTALWQGGGMYQPDNDNPYPMFASRGKIYKAVPDGAVTLLSTTAALSHPANLDYFYFCQGEQFMVIQAGDNVTLPLFWDGSTLRRSDGQSVNLGVTSVDFTSPAQLGDSVLITLAAPGWQGHDNQIFELGGDSSAVYIQVRGNQFITLKNIAAPTGTLDAGSQIVKNGVNMSKLISQFTIPAVGASNNVFVTPAYIGAVNDFVTIGGLSFQVTAIGIPDVAPPQIRAVNLNQAPGTVNAKPISLTSVQEIGAAGPMDYCQGRLWYAIGRQYLAGDIVRGPSGTAFYDFRDSILKVTENPLCLAGDGFTVPDNAGNIRAIFHNANINTTLGQGNLYIATKKAIYSLDVPVTRTDWIAAGNNNQPKQTVVQINNGAVNDRSCVLLNGDVWYRTLEPSIASLFTQVRNFSQWGNLSLSNNEQRILQFEDRALLRFTSGIYFNNRMLQSALPKQRDQGVVSQGIIPLDVVPISSFGATLTPNWEGVWQGLDVLQLFVGDFGGRERAFAAIVSTQAETLGAIQLWELSTSNQFDSLTNPAASALTAMTGNVDPAHRITWFAELPSFTWGDLFQLKKLVSAELGIDRIVGTCDFKIDYRPDFASCWSTWWQFSICSAKNSCEDPISPICYPMQPRCPGYRQTITLPTPQNVCNEQEGRPLNIGYSFQLRITVHGSCRIRGVKLFAEDVERKAYENLICPPSMTI